VVARLVGFSGPPALCTKCIPFRERDINIYSWRVLGDNGLPLCNLIPIFACKDADFSSVIEMCRMFAIDVTVGIG
jgi:hypothetical protein